jgi:hypothetical protein
MRHRGLQARGMGTRHPKSRRPCCPAAATRRPGGAGRATGQDAAGPPRARRRGRAVPMQGQEPPATALQGQAQPPMVPPARKTAATVPPALAAQATGLMAGILAVGRWAGTGMPPGRFPARRTLPGGGTARCRPASIRCHSSGRSLRRTSPSGECRSWGRPARRPAWRPLPAGRCPPSLPRRQAAGHPRRRRRVPWTATPTRWLSAVPGTSGRSAARRRHRNRRPTTSGRPGIPPSLRVLLPDPDSLRRPGV